MPSGHVNPARCRVLAQEAGDQPDNGGVTASASPGPQASLAGQPRRRDEILRAAAGLFAAEGYRNTSMREVAAASGILAGSLYHHFASKEAIAVELVEDYHADLVRAARECGLEPADPLGALRAFAQEIAEVSSRHRAALQICMFDAPTTASSSLKTVVHAEPASLDRRWRTLIRAASAAGTIKDSVDLRILRHVLHQTTVQETGEWGIAAEPRAFADCITTLLFEGLARTAPASGDTSKATQVVDDARARWAADAAQWRRERRGQVLDVARSQFALRGFEATTMRDIADAAGLTASNLYRYLESKDAMIREILGYFSDRLLEAYRDVIQAGSSVTQTLDAILWLLDQAGRHFSREIEILASYTRLLALGVADRYQDGAQARFEMLIKLIDEGVAAGELNQVAGSDLVATCLRDIMWAPMRNLAPISAQRVRDFYRHSVLSGAATHG
jgi:AcrR family transcriptional regulator